MIDASLENPPTINFVEPTLNKIPPLQEEMVQTEHIQNIRMESLKIAVTLLEDYIKENTLSPRDNSMDIIWEVANKCVDYCNWKS